MDGFHGQLELGLGDKGVPAGAVYAEERADVPGVDVRHVLASDQNLCIRQCLRKVYFMGVRLKSRFFPRDGPGSVPARFASGLGF